MTQAVLDNGRLRVVVELGGGAVSFFGRSDGPNLLAERSWASPIPTTLSTSYGDDELDFLANYRGGWHELFPNAGAGCRVLGTQMPFHGDVSRALWSLDEFSTSSLTMSCPSRLPVVLHRRMHLEGDCLLLEERVVNESQLNVPVLWGHHPVFSAVPGMRIDLPGGTIRVDPDFVPQHADLEPASTGTWPFTTGRSNLSGPVDLGVIPDGFAERLVYVDDLPEAWTALRDPNTGTGVAYSWDGTTFPAVWLWLQVGGVDFPWFGRTSYVAVEPQSMDDASGLADAIERGRALTVPRGGLDTWLTFRVFAATDAAVTHMGSDGRLEWAPSGSG